MQAIRVSAFGPPEVMKLEQVADPTPGAGQIVVRIRAIGVNPVDTYIRAGKHGTRSLSYTPGKDAAGIVEAVGEGIASPKVGDRVYVSNSITGTYAERALCDASSVHPLPAKITFSHGASLGVPAGIAYFSLFDRGAARAGEIVLVHGATGSVGIAAMQFARAAGLTVFGTAGDESGRQFVLEQGAHQAFDHNITDDPARLKELISGKGINLILEMLADKNLAKDLPALADRGRVVVIGSRGKIEIDPRDTMQRNADIRGATLERTTPEEHSGIYAAITAALEAGTLRSVIAMELPLADAAQSHHAVLAHHAPGKIILRPNGSTE